MCSQQGLLLVTLLTLLAVLARTTAGAALVVQRDPVAPASCYFYTMQKGDTLASIASKAGLSVADITKSNPKGMKATAESKVRLCNLPADKAKGLRVDIMVYNQYTSNGYPYLRMDNGYSSYWVVPMPATYATAKSFCIGVGGNLASLTRQGEEKELAVAIAYMSSIGSVDLWLGATRPAGASSPASGWRWLDGAKSNYTNWWKGHAFNTKTKDPACMTLNVAKTSTLSHWTDTPCQNINPGFVCKLKAQGKLAEQILPAPEPAVAVKKAKNKEDVYEFRMTQKPSDVARMWVVPAPRSMPDADAFCKANGGTLASVHTATGLDQVRQVASRVSGFFWIGLMYGGKPPSHVWTDGTQYTYNAFAPGQPSGLGICTLLSAWSKLAGSAYFLDVPCELQMTFVCRFSK